MQVALLHQVAADALTIAVGKQNVVWQNNCRTSAAVLIQATVDVLQEVELLVASRESEVITGSTLATLLGAKGRIGQDNIISAHFLAEIGQGIAQIDRAANIMQHSVH